MPFSNAKLSALFAIILTFSTVSGPVLAQTESADDTSTAETSETPVTDENGLALGEPEDSSPKPGETYVKEVFGDWSLRCIFLEDQEDPCQMYQLLSDEQGQPVSEFTLFRLPEGGQAAAGATVVVPLETGLQEQLSIKVDDKQGKRYPYSFCNSIGCYARIGLTLEDVEDYKSGAEAVLSIVPALDPQRRVIRVTMSLSGFTAAFEQASEIDQ